MNGYAKIVGMNGGFGLSVFPPDQNGRAITISEVMEYLNFHKITYNLDMIKDCFNANEIKTVQLGVGECPRCNESYKLNISEDFMEASVIFWPPSDTGSRMSVEEFMNDMKYRNITYGLQNSIIDNFFANPVYFEEIKVAIGSKPRHGKDAVIEYHFRTTNSYEPTRNEDGSVDFFNLNNINHCKKGDILATMIPADYGDVGYTINGTALKPREVKTQMLKFGLNVTLSPDKLNLISGVDGHVMLVEDKVFVSNVYQVENVGIGTGNINFEGSVQVDGNVLNGFSVKAGGNVEVRGVVEGAFIEAGGDIIITNGVNGMGKGNLIAHGNIVTKFIENANVSAEGYIRTDSILHSNVSSGSDIYVESKKGFITGGRVSAANKIRVKTLGGSMGASTVVEVGMNPELRKQYIQLQKDMLESQNAIKNAQPIILNYNEKKARGTRFSQEQIDYIKSLIKLCEEKKTDLLSKKELYLELQKKIMEQGKSVIEVTGEAYPGTTIAIKDVSTTLQNICRLCKFYFEGGEIKLTNL